MSAQTSGSGSFSREEISPRSSLIYGCFNFAPKNPKNPGISDSRKIPSQSHLCYKETWKNFLDKNPTENFRFLHAGVFPRFFSDFNNFPLGPLVSRDRHLAETCVTIIYCSRKDFTSSDLSIVCCQTIAIDGLND